LKLDDITSNELDTLDDLLTVGEVVAVRVSYAAGAVRLSMLDVDDTDPMTAPPVLVEGGIPWLQYGRNLPLHKSLPGDLEAQPSEGWSPAQGSAAFAPATDPNSPSTGISDRAANRKALQDALLALDSARSEIAQLKQRFHTAEIAKTPLPDQPILAAQERLSPTELEFQLHAAERKNETQQQALIAASERLADLRKKLRGARTESGATRHAPVFSDEEEQVRHEIEQNSEAARRLHYWKRADGLVELSRVVTHDDYKP
jgi:hypothetical protein